MVNVHMNGNWRDDNHIGKEGIGDRREVGGKDQFTSNVLFSYFLKSHAPIFKPHPKR